MTITSSRLRPRGGYRSRPGVSAQIQFVEVVKVAASIPAKDNHIIAIHHRGVVTTSSRRCARGGYRSRPGIGAQIQFVEVVLVRTTIIPAKHNHIIAVKDRGVSVTRSWRRARGGYCP